MIGVVENDRPRPKPYVEFGWIAFALSVMTLLLGWTALAVASLDGFISGHAALVAASFGLAGVGLCDYMWATRVERQEFAARVAKAELIRHSLQWGGYSRGTSPRDHMRRR